MLIPAKIDIFIGGLVSKRLNSKHNCELVRSFEEDEVKQVVWDCGGNNSPGPDGFAIKFIRKMWEVLKKDVMHFMAEFH